MEALSLNLTERHADGDGQAYTFAEYADFYGFQSALTFWHTAFVWLPNGAEQPVDTIVGHPESRAEQPGDINSAAQPVDITASQPKVACEHPDNWLQKIRTIGGG
jgi:hypothetical protein